MSQDHSGMSLGVIQGTRPDAAHAVGRSAMQPLTFGLVNVRNPTRKWSINKDLNGGYGTADDFAHRVRTRLIAYFRRRLVRLPVLSYAWVQAILRRQGHTTWYWEDVLPDRLCDVFLIYGSIVDHRYEDEVCELIKQRFPSARVGVFGPFPSHMPGVYPNADFVLCGEAEAFFQNHYEGIEQLTGHVPVPSTTDMDALPSPDLTGMDLSKYRYAPAISAGPFFTLQASRGCPYSCAHYCTYGAYQGPKVRQRSAARVADDMAVLNRQFGVRSVQFRDPLFGVKRAFIEEFVEELAARRINMQWGIETRIDLLDEDILARMACVGLRNINVGIETVDRDVAKLNKRPLVAEDKQERLVRVCERLGVKISALYILGLDDDTEDAIMRTIAYARRLNTHLARFSIATPYPGTGFYSDLEQSDRILTGDYERFTQFNPVYEHSNLSTHKLRALLDEAYIRYYFRWSFVTRMLQWRVFDARQAWRQLNASTVGRVKHHLTSDSREDRDHSASSAA